MITLLKSNALIQNHAHHKIIQSYQRVMKIFALAAAVHITNYMLPLIILAYVQNIINANHLFGNMSMEINNVNSHAIRKRKNIVLKQVKMKLNVLMNNMLAHKVQHNIVIIRILINQPAKSIIVVTQMLIMLVNMIVQPIIVY